MKIDFVARGSGTVDLGAADDLPADASGAVVDRIVDLINSKPRSPTRNEIDDAIRGGRAGTPTLLGRSHRMLTAAQIENIQYVIEELMSQFNEAESDGKKELHLVTALGAKFNQRVERAYFDLQNYEHNK